MVIFSDQLLVEFFPLVQTLELDLDVFIRLQSGHPYQVPGHVRNFDGLAHFQDKGFSTLPLGSGLEDQLPGLKMDDLPAP